VRVLEQVIGHSNIIEKLLEGFQNEKPGQTFLFLGPSGVGKKLTAKGFAQALLCEINRKGCGSCSSCLRLENEQHESFKIISAEGAHIKVEQSREILEFLSLRSLSTNRIIVIDQAQTLNPIAANALLKIFEEPPEGTFFFLIAPSVAGILPTIRSRSRIVQFKPLNSQEMATKIQAPSWALKACGGSFEKLAQLQEPHEIEVRGKAAEILELLVNDLDFLVNEKWRDGLKDRAGSLRMVSYWISFLRDAMVLKGDSKEMVLNVDQEKLLKTLFDVPTECLLKLLNEAVKMEQGILGNQDVVLLVEKMHVEAMTDYVV
jgi:DNA polymerase-3 subunit delta'